jgi:transposase
MVEATNLGYATKTPHFNSVSNYLSDAELTPVLKSLVTMSSLPLKAVETDFAVDSSGFSTCVYDRWFDAKYGRIRSEAQWLKAHLMCGVKTHIITSIEVTQGDTGDNPQFPVLVNQTAKSFNINEVSADKAYSDRRNLHTVEAIGGTAYIPFKSNSTGVGDYYNFNRNNFMAHYHKRSNVETAYSMIKAKFGGFVRSKSMTAQINEVLCKVICHNICVLIQSIHELGIEPVFEHLNVYSGENGPLVRAKCATREKGWGEWRGYDFSLAQSTIIYNCLLPFIFPVTRCRPESHGVSSKLHLIGVMQ